MKRLPLAFEPPHAGWLLALQGRHPLVPRAWQWVMLAILTPCALILLGGGAADPLASAAQFCDHGTQYRSAIFFTSDEQLAEAQRTIADVEASGLWPGKVVTELAPAGDFWEAEDVHQDYLERYPNGYSCHFPRKDWVLPRAA